MAHLALAAPAALGVVTIDVAGMSSLRSIRSNPSDDPQGDTMNITSDISNVRPTTVAFVNCHNATTFGRTVHMTAYEERRLRGLLTALCDAGLILRASFAPALPDYGYSEAVEQLRGSIGAHIVDALIGGDRVEPDREPAPAAVMPVWTFEPEGPTDDVLLSSAKLWNTDLLVEALRVEDDDDPAPLPSVRDRFDRWANAAGQGGKLKTVRLPGRDGSYVIFAAAAPA